MANAYKILGQATVTANTIGAVYTVPASTSAIVNAVHVTNFSASNASFSIAVVPSGGVVSAATLPKYFITRGVVVPAGDTAQLDFVMTLAAGAVLAANASSSSVSVSAFGAEIS